MIVFILYEQLGPGLHCFLRRLCVLPYMLTLHGPNIMSSFMDTPPRKIIQFYYYLSPRLMGVGGGGGRTSKEKNIFYLLRVVLLLNE